MPHLLRRRMLHSHIKTRLLRRITSLRRCLRSVWKQVFCCWMGDSVTYKQLQYRINNNTSSTPSLGVLESKISSNILSLPSQSHEFDLRDPSDIVPLKISLLGDRQIGKTSFLAKYVGKENGQESIAVTGTNQVDKTLYVQGARISYSIWDVGGDDSSHNHIPDACRDSVAMLFMFDLTSRCTLNSVITWYQQARKWNQTAIPVLVGTKFDDFVQLPIDLQWTIASEARAYAKALNATLFFSSATYNINVNKIFKFITAKLFNVPWTLERNLTVGEPLIDF